MTVDWEKRCRNTSCVVLLPGSEKSVRKAQSNPDLSLDVHVWYVFGWWLGQVKDISYVVLHLLSHDTQFGLNPPNKEGSMRKMLQHVTVSGQLVCVCAILCQSFELSKFEVHGIRSSFPLKVPFSLA